MNKYYSKRFAHIRDATEEFGNLFNEIDSNIFYTKEWYQNYEDNISDDYNNELIIQILKTSKESIDDETVGAVFLKEESRRNYLFKYEIISSLANYYTTYHNVLLKEGSDYKKIVKAFIQDLEHYNNKCTISGYH